MQFFTLTPLPVVVGNISAALDLSTVGQTSPLAVQLSAWVAGDTFDIYESDRSDLTTLAQLGTSAQLISGLSGLTPITIGGIRNPYIYVARTAGTAACDMYVSGNVAGTTTLTLTVPDLVASVPVNQDLNAADLTSPVSCQFTAAAATDSCDLYESNLATWTAASATLVGSITGPGVFEFGGLRCRYLFAKRTVRTTASALSLTVIAQIPTYSTISVAIAPTPSTVAERGTSGELKATSFTGGAGIATSVDSPTTEAVNIGTGAGAKTVTVGTITNTTTFVRGGGAVNLDAKATAGGLVNIGTGLLDGFITIGSNVVGAGISGTSIYAGTSGIVLGTYTTGPINIDSGTSGAINIGTGAQSKTVTVGNSAAATGIMLASGTSGVTIASSLGGASSTVVFGPGGVVGPYFPSPGRTRAAELVHWTANQGLPAVAAGGTNPSGACFDGTSVWVATMNTSTNSIVKITAQTGVVASTIALGTYGTNAYSCCFDGLSVWVVNQTTANVSKILVSSSAITATTTVGATPYGICYDGANIWVSSGGATGTLSKITGSTGANLATYTVGNALRGVAFDGTNIWVASSAEAFVYKVGPTGTILATITVGTTPTGVCFDGQCIWVANAGSSNVTKLQIGSGTVVGTYTVGAGPNSVVWTGARIWVTNQTDGTATCLRQGDGAVLGTYTIGTAPKGGCFDGVNMWFPNSGSANISRL